MPAFFSLSGGALAIADDLLTILCPLPTVQHLPSSVFLLFIKLGDPMLRLPADQESLKNSEVLQISNTFLSLQRCSGKTCGQSCSEQANQALPHASCMDTLGTSQLYWSIYAPFHLLKVSVALSVAVCTFFFLILKAAF